MSIHDAMIDATHTVLGEYLAPDLAARLADAIVAHARPQIEAALLSLAGFELGKSSPSRTKSTASRPTRGRQRQAEAAPDPAVHEVHTPHVVMPADMA